MPVLIDPPEGWRYGFPKALPDNLRHDPQPDLLTEWLVENGYPRDLVEPMDVVKG